MSKRKIRSAAKKRGVTVVDAHYAWRATPGEMVPGWQVEFGPELDDEILDFETAADVIEFIETAELAAQAKGE